jgi:Mrp family chromosome partitioning ATPase
MKELSAQRADLDRQITAEARKILDSLEREAELAAARETQIGRSLDQLKAVAARANDAGVQLRALEREAAAQRDLLDSYLRRYREALAREQTDYAPADARIISRAATPIEPDYPKKVPMTAAASVTALILAVAFVLLRELASGRPMRRFALPGPLPTPPAGPGLALAADRALRRLTAKEPTLAPELADGREEPVTAVAAKIGAAGAKRVLVTSAADFDNHGRPLAAVALARALARTDARVVVLDFRGDDANTMSMGEGADLPGVSDLFDGEASFAQVIFRDQRSRVHFISAGEGPLTAEALADERLETILSALTLTYDCVIIDARDDLIAMLAPGCGAAVVVSPFDADDRRTEAAVQHIRAVSDADVEVLVVDASDETAQAAPLLPRAKARETAGEAA